VEHPTSASEPAGEPDGEPDGEPVDEPDTVEAYDATPIGGAAGPRRAARERALELLYEAEVKGCTVADIVDALPLAPDPYAVALAGAAQARQAATDELLGQFSHRWDVHRMPAVDRAVLRLAVGELASQPDVPARVVLNEAVDLAKRYSTEESGRFVNGLLSRVAHEVRPGELDAPDER
jgi:N utilization substance protein B